MTSKGILFIGAVAASVLAGPSLASAQIVRDDPPGSAIQDRGYAEENGYAPEEGYSSRYYRGSRAYGRYEYNAPRRFYPNRYGYSYGD
jgi:hypothetical protein